MLLSLLLSFEWLISYYCLHCAQTNTFQGVIAKSGNETYAIYLYADGLMQWTSGSDGTNGFGGYSASVGYTITNGSCLSYHLYYKNLIFLPGSDTCSIIYINVGVNGQMLVFLECLCLLLMGLTLCLVITNVVIIN